MSLLISLCLSACTHHDSFDMLDHSSQNDYYNMFMTVSVGTIIIGIILWILLAIGIGKLAKRYKRDVLLWVLVSIFISPFLAFILLALYGKSEMGRVMEILENEQIKRRSYTNIERIQLTSFLWKSAYQQLNQVIKSNKAYMQYSLRNPNCYINEETLEKLHNSPKPDNLIRMADNKITAIHVYSQEDKNGVKMIWLPIIVDASLPENIVEIRFE